MLTYIQKSMITLQNSSLVSKIVYISYMKYSSKVGMPDMIWNKEISMPCWASCIVFPLKIVKQVKSRGMNSHWGEWSSVDADVEVKLM